MFPTDWSTIAATLLGMLLLPGSVYLAVLSLAGLRYRAPAADGPCLAGRIAIVVPAHDEAAGIADTVDNLTAIARHDGACAVWVVADNCRDATARIAAEHGARVLERQDPARRGKGYALDHAFRTLAPQDYAAFVVVDADSLAEPDLLRCLRRHLGGGAQVVQARYTMYEGRHAGASRLAELAVHAFNSLRPRGRHALGLSAGLLGNGFALRAEVLQHLPYDAASVVEDLEYHLRLVEAGYRVHFADDTALHAAMPETRLGRQNQRARWEGGRLRMQREHAPRLLGRVLHGQWRFVEPLTELLLPPLSRHVLLLLVLAALPCPWAPLAALGGFGILGTHVFIAARLAGLGWRELAAIALQLPAYLLWKLRLMSAIRRASSTSTPWIRTDRDRA